MTYPVTGRIYAGSMKIYSFGRNSDGVPSTPQSGRVLWRMRGPKRVIAAHLLNRPEGHELVVFFEDSDKGVIESQFDPFGVQGLVDRAETLKEILRRKGLTPVEDHVNTPEAVMH